MDNGKRICKTLKELRRRIAEANGLQITIEDCPFTGPCLGTCPRCEAELEELYDQLHWLEQEGGKIKLKDLMTEEELNLFNANDPSQVAEYETSPMHQGEERICGDIRPAREDYGNSQFTYMLAERLFALNKDANLVFSPIGIYSALKALRLGMKSNSTIYRKVRELLKHTSSDLPESPSYDCTVEQATSLWVDREKGEVNDSFIKSAAKKADAAVFNRKFADPDACKAELDQWVSAHTGEAIKSLDMELSPYAFMVLMNAIYLKAKWEQPFDEADTKIRQFTNADGSKSKVEMMQHTFHCPDFEEDTHYKAISLPYADINYSMVIVLPNRFSDFDKVISSGEWISPEEYDFEGYMHCPNGFDVALSLPKFKFDVKVDMVETLREFGLGAMFDSYSSFPKISDEPVNVSQFFQQCAFSVNEEGTEAAAASVVELEVGCLPRDEHVQKYRMTVNRPFGFAVKYYDGDKERIIFTGVVKQLDNVEQDSPKTEKLIYKRLTSITVAGTSHIENIEELAEDIEVGTKLHLEHDKNNEHDCYAVALYHDGERIGYLPRGENEIIANLLDAGTQLIAVVTNTEWRGDWLYIAADIKIAKQRPPESTFSVEKASPSDAESIARFQYAMALETENTMLDLGLTFRGVTDLISDTEKGLCLVARNSKGEILASLYITKEWSDWHCAWYWWIQSVYVRPEYRQQGVYREMYEKVREMALEADVISIRLYTDENNSRAKAAYKTLGMTKSDFQIYEEKLK